MADHLWMNTKTQYGVNSTFNYKLANAGVLHVLYTNMTYSIGTSPALRYIPDSLLLTTLVLRLEYRTVWFR